MARGFVLLTAAVCSTAGAAPAKPAEYPIRPDAWFAGGEARRVAANILSRQADLGGWPKNVDTTAGPYAGDRTALRPGD